uniref:Concentrative nucleoside transporter C-terminal domain-containing protein n=1 Tax=Plectus sambesii TaxID=2011161 RepID=A0A914UYP1_9BILA
VLVGYLFFPLAYIMGASDATDPDAKIAETLKVAQLMGSKTVLNEFIAYQQMSGMIMRKEIGPRAQMIATYALCGYSNFSQIASQLAMYGSMCPQKKAVYAKVAFKSMIAGGIACFMTACIAGRYCCTSAILKSHQYYSRKRLCVLSFLHVNKG